MIVVIVSLRARNNFLEIHMLPVPLPLFLELTAAHE
jgi:hypothetical protein